MWIILQRCWNLVSAETFNKRLYFLRRRTDGPKVVLDITLQVILMVRQWVYQLRQCVVAAGTSEVPWWCKLMDLFLKAMCNMGFWQLLLHQTLLMLHEISTKKVSVLFSVKWKWIGNTGIKLVVILLAPLALLKPSGTFGLRCSSLAGIEKGFGSWFLVCSQPKWRLILGAHLGYGATGRRLSRFCDLSWMPPQSKHQLRSNFDV